MAAAAAVLLFWAAPKEALAQQVTVTGVVVERTESSWIGGATVRLSGLPPFFTDLDGRFWFPGVPLGRHTLIVQAMGYRARSLDLVIQADTSIVIEMDPDPILLDSLLVRAGTIDIKGDLYDAVTGERILFAQVTVLPGFPTESAIGGSFTVRGVPVGRAVAVVVEAIEYLPARIALITEADTTLKVELEHDSVGIRLIAERVQRLETRSNAMPLSKKVIDRDDMARMPGWTIYSMIRARLMGRFSERYNDRERESWPCIVIDEVRVRHPAFLWGLTGAEVERVEIFGNGKMVRVYTKRYVLGRLGRNKRLTSLMWGICR